MPCSTNVVSVRVISWGVYVVWPGFLYFGGFVNKTIIPLVLLGYEVIVTTSALCGSLPIYHLISNARSWNNR